MERERERTDGERAREREGIREPKAKIALSRQCWLSNTIPGPADSIRAKNKISRLISALGY